MKILDGMYASPLSKISGIQTRLQILKECVKILCQAPPSVSSSGYDAGGVGGHVRERLKEASRAMRVKGEEAREFQYLLALGIIVVHVEPVVGDSRVPGVAV